MKKIIVLLSGGLDSSFAAYLLKEQGYSIFGIVLKMYDNSLSPTEIHNINIIKEKLNINIKIIDVRKEFKTQIIDYFINTYKEGKTPNPCARCNPEIKFSVGISLMKEYDFDFIASGHYADKGYYKDYLTLKTAKDLSKTQEYFLARILPNQLNYILFPLSNFTKKEVKIESRKIFPEIINRKESQDVCFLKGLKVEDFLKNSGIELIGKMVYKDAVVNENVNLLAYTRGQRRKINFSAGHRVYVKNIDTIKKIIELGKKEELAISSFNVSEPLFYVPINKISNCSVKVRYSKNAVPCTLKEIENNEIRVYLKNPLHTVTLGQLAVFYSNNHVLGSGWISALN